MSDRFRVPIHPVECRNACRDGRTNADCGDSGLMGVSQGGQGAAGCARGCGAILETVSTGSPDMQRRMRCPQSGTRTGPNAQRVRQGRGSIVACPATLAGAWQAKNAKELLFQVTARSKVLPCRIRTVLSGILRRHFYGAAIIERTTSPS
jgi:hypothetical protein